MAENNKSMQLFLCFTNSWKRGLFMG